MPEPTGTPSTYLPPTSGLAATPAWRVAYSFFMANLVAGGLAVCLTGLSWAVDHLLGLPLSVLYVMFAIVLIVSAAVGITIFARTWRAETRMANGDDPGGLPWHPFPSLATRRRS